LTRAATPLYWLNAAPLCGQSLARWSFGPAAGDKASKPGPGTSPMLTRCKRFPILAGQSTHRSALPGATDMRWPASVCNPRACCCSGESYLRFAKSRGRWAAGTQGRRPALTLRSGRSDRIAKSPPVRSPGPADSFCTIQSRIKPMPMHSTRKSRPSTMPPSWPSQDKRPQEISFRQRGQA